MRGITSVFTITYIYKNELAQITILCQFDTSVSDTIKAMRNDT